MTEFMTQDAKGTGGIAKTASNVNGSLFVDDDGTECFVLALERKLGREEEASVGIGCYVIFSTDAHNYIALQNPL